MHPAPVYAVTEVRTHYGYSIVRVCGAVQSTVECFHCFIDDSSLITAYRHLGFALQIKGITLDAHGSKFWWLTVDGLLCGCAVCAKS